MKANPPCFVALGRYGDIIQLMPAFREIYQRTDLKPVVIVSSRYANVLEGVSYVRIHPINCDWWRGIPLAYRIAQEVYGGGVVPQWWHLPKNEAGVVDNPGGIILQSHGEKWGVDISKWPNYGTSMWDRAGFTVEEMMTLPLIFDRRDWVREKELVAKHRRTKKPMFLVNYTGQSSPFAPMPEIHRVVMEFSDYFEIVDLGIVQGVRIYDLLGFMDRAAGMLTIDTSTLHLAPASKVPYIAYTVNGWCSSVPKGNCITEIKYNDSIRRLDHLRLTLQQLKSNCEVRKDRQLATA